MNPEPKAKNQKPKKNFLLILFIVQSSLFMVQSAEAIGLAVEPRILNLKAEQGQPKITEILVTNVSAEPALFQVYPESFGDDITAAPQNFRLEAKANQIVKITVLAKTPKKIATNIAVLAKPLGVTGFITGSGVKVPLNIEIEGWGWRLWQVGLGIFLLLAICLLAVIMVKFKKKRTI